ncbi:hypothetical protein [Paenibacillus sp. WLX2291]|uniref:hypothetical protein n=1 Tax=Paenibacillus sp. WLX2291 TaxID=3296934 RepID=UPI003983FBFA
MAVTLRKRPSITGTDARKLIARIEKNNEHHQNVLRQLNKEHNYETTHSSIQADDQRGC